MGRGVDVKVVERYEECVLVLKDNIERFFVISDNHFYHNKMISREPIRSVYKQLGFHSQEDMMIHCWNAVIGPKDFVLHLGDFSWRESSEKMLEELFDKLNGRIFMVVGNHDRDLYEIYKKHVECAFGGGNIYIDKGNQFEKIDSGFKRVNGILLTINDKKILFSHYPVFTNRSVDEARTKFLKEIALDYGIHMNIFGHIHSLRFPEIIDNVEMINVSVENTRFVPFKMSNIIDYLL